MVKRGEREGSVSEGEREKKGKGKWVEGERKNRD